MIFQCQRNYVDYEQSFILLRDSTVGETRERVIVLTESSPKMRTVKREKHARVRGRQFSCAFSCFTHFIVRSLRNSLTKKLKSY